MKAFVSITEREWFDMLRGCPQPSSTWTEFTQALREHNGHSRALTHVSMDMSAAFVKGVKENGRNTQIDFDKFHLLQYAGQAVDPVRWREMRAADEEQRQMLYRSRWL